MTVFVLSIQLLPFVIASTPLQPQLSTAFWATDVELSNLVHLQASRSGLQGSYEPPPDIGRPKKTRGSGGRSTPHYLDEMRS
ncbi:MAG: hypothetical protein HC866_17795 [Leptolyngbyaceae cyanobacterium RU_5_1]|nr:hypothetical protein [Leptolyngbyaceae cyanobacterium RU_5_1]